MKIARKPIIKDTLWYILGSAIPMLIGVLRTPVFTRYFTPEEYGYYGLIYITYSIISIFLFSWLTNCVWRFYNYYKKRSSLKLFYSNLFILYLTFSIIFLGITFFWLALSKEIVTRRLILLIFIQLSISSPLNYILIIYRLELKSKKYNLIQIIRALISFIVLFSLTFQLHLRIEAIPIASIIIDVIIILCILPGFLKTSLLSLKYFSKKVIKNLFGFALPGIISNLTVLVLVSSDRYLIAYFGTISEVGIYNQVYNLSQVSIMALVNLFFAIINPFFLKQLEYNFKGTKLLTQNYIYIFIILILPITVYISLFSKQLAFVLLGKDFQSGFDLIPWVAISSFLYGLTLFHDNRLKFSSHYKAITIGFLISSILNVTLNYFLIPVYSYKFAAVSTLLSYFVLYLYFQILDLKKNGFHLSNIKLLLPALSILSFQIIIDFILNELFDSHDSLTWVIQEAVFFIITYAIILYFFSKKHILKWLISFK